MTPKKIFETGLQYHHYANTAYPLTPHSFKSFRIATQDEYLEFLKQDWEKSDELSIYVHIPFCKIRCRFCEYVVLENTDLNTEDFYVSLLLKEIEMYRQIIKEKKIVGYDMGGGTPTKLSVENIGKITDALRTSYNFAEDVVFSIETTPVIAAQEPEKLNAIYNFGYKRISMGIQTVSEKLLNDLGREGTTQIYEKAVDNIRKAGFKRFNIDLMYGFLYQNNEDFENTLKYAIALNPEYITLYRNRYKGTKMETEAGGVSLYKIITQYKLAYDVLTQHGYMANPGKNTFSKIKDDYGTSDYLTKRVIEGTPYVGFGLGAQSFGNSYLAYNSGAADKKLNKYKDSIDNNQIPIQDIYELDLQEAIAKMVSVAFYFGFVDLTAFSKRFHTSFTGLFKEEINFVISEGLMEMSGDRLMLTGRGADYINGIIPLFYSERSKAELMALYNKSKTISTGEAEFLKAYNIQEFERPSVAVDIVVLSREKQQQVDIFYTVLIKRGEHPFMNYWALPGGFVPPTESVEATAYRELKEETGITNITLTQLQVFSEPKRDPRGWIISCAFLGIIEKEKIALRFGDDAIDTQIFKLKLSRTQMEREFCNPDKSVECYDLELSSNEIVLSARVDKETTFLTNGEKIIYNITESKGLAFDHAKILVMAMENVMTKS